MRTAFIFCLMALIAFAAASDVVTGTNDNFDETIASADFVLVEFYAPWCGHCKKLAPEWEKAATELKGKAVLVALDATVHEKAASKFGIQGYPTIKVFRDGELAGDYDGGRTADGIVKYVKGNSGPAVNTVADSAALDAIKAENDVVVVLFNAEETAAFTAAAKALRASATFALVSDSALFDGAAGSIVVYKTFDSKRDVFEGAADSSAEIQAFVKGAAVRLFDEIGPENYKSYMERGLPMGWLFVKPSAADAQATKDELAAIAGDFAGKISLVWIDADKYGQMAGRMGLKGTNFPSFAIDHEGQHFVWEDKPIASADLKKFVGDYIDGTLKATVKSEEKPAEHTVEGLTTLVGDSFQELVMESDVDVLIEFYAPWCGHCKSLAPEYKKAAKELEDKPVRIAMIDATANDYPQKTFNVQGFPTLYWFPKATREPVAYEGGRTAADIQKFVEEKLA